MMAEQVALYRKIPPPGQPITMEVQPFLVEDSIPEEEEIAWAVHRLCLNWSGGPSGMRAEHFRHWLIAATRDNAPGVTNFQKVVATLQSAFHYGTLAEECT